MRKHKGESCNQYGQGNVSICVLRAKWKQANLVRKSIEPTLFISGAWGGVSRRFAAEIIRQFRRSDTAIKNLGNPSNKGR
jgi:hypothetical protein